MRTKTELTEILKDEIIALGVNVTDKDLRDFDFKGDETDGQIIEWARDYVSECQSEEAEAKQAWRYEH
jgi:hypothetical protein